MASGTPMSSNDSALVMRMPRHLMTFYGVVLFVLLSCLYLLLFRGHPLSIDEISTFDSIESLTQHGTLSRTIEFYRQPIIAEDGSPFLPPLYEPLQIIAAAPFYLAAQAVPRIGQFQAVFLLNVFLTALTAVSVYIVALRQGYQMRTAWLGGLLFGIATLALPYSRWLFREPLMSFFALWSFAFTFELRQRMQMQRPVRWHAVVLVVSIFAMLLTKQAGLLFIPGLLVSLTPPVKFLRRFAPIGVLLFAALLLFLIALAVLNPDFGDDRYNLSRWLNPANLGLSFMAESALGYQISPARSFWLYSPILLFAFVGGAILIRRETRWLVYGIVLTFVLSSAFYGALRLGAFWNGGWGWGPRYMLPMVPLVMLLVLPVIERLPAAPRWGRITFAAVSIVSIAIQLIGIAVPYTDFYNRYYLQETAETSWLAENWSWQNTAIAYHLEHFSLDSFDSAWRFAEPLAAMPLYLLGLVALALFAVRYVSRRVTVGRSAVYGICVALLMLVLLGGGLGLFVLRYDRRYIGTHRDVYELVQRLNTRVTPDDTVFLSGNEYMVLFMNWFKAGALYITLPEDAPLPPPTDTQRVTAAEFEQVAGPETRSAMDWASRHSRELWLVMSPLAYRRTHAQWYKRYLSATTYPVGVTGISPFAETARFETGLDTVFTAEELQPPPSFGERLSLISASLPADLTFRVRDVIPLALQWTPLQPLDENYQISVQILDAEEVLIAQQDTAPLNGYGQMAFWQPGVIYEDHHAVVLPAGLPAGEYTLHVVVYRLETLDRLSVQIGGQPSPGDTYLLTAFSIR